MQFPLTAIPLSLIILRHFLSVTSLLAILVIAANGQQGVMTGQERSAQPADPADFDDVATPSNYTSVFTRIVGTDAWRSSIGGLRNVGSGTISINGVNGTVTRAYLFWHGVSNSFDPAVNSGLRVNGFTVFGTPIGTSYDNSWGYSVSQGYRADVTQIVGSSPNKPYLLSNFGSETFNPNGASLIIFYNDSNSTNDYDVTILNGNDSNGASGYDPGGWDANFGAVYDYGVIGDSFDLIVADGQTPFDPTLFLNGQILRNAGPLYQGDSVLSAGGGAGNGSLWDIREYNFDAYVVPNAFNNLRLTSAAPSFPDYPDYTSLVAAIAYIPIGPERVFITNQRISGNLNNTTQNALLGADVSLQANLYPEGLTGGSFSWTITGPHQIVSGSTNTNTLNVRWIEQGTYSVRVNYVRNGVTITGSMNVNVIAPTLSVFSGNMVDVDQVTRGLPCSDRPGAHAKYSLGCASFRGSEPRGMVFNATAGIPSGQYLTDLAQSGIKFRHFGSEFSRRKRDTYNGGMFTSNPYNPYLDGRDECLTGRSSKADIDSGWRTDGGEIFNGSLQPLPRFSAGNSISTSVFDLPSQYLDTPPGSAVGSTDMLDAQSLEVFFEMYVYYYTGDPDNPTFQQPMRLATHSTPYSKIPWTWAGQAYFDAQNFPTVKYVLQFSNTTPLGAVPAVPASTPRASSGNLNQNWVNCQDSPPPTTNALDSVRFFVKNQYERILFRPPEAGGWDAWTSVITRCVFDSSCIHTMRIVVARDIFNSPEHLNREPALGTNPVGSPEYNRAYVRLCYTTYLEHEPQNGEEQGWINFINSTGDYTTLIGGFVNSPEYRSKYVGVVFR